MNDRTEARRQRLIARATELGVFDRPEDRTDEELFWAIRAEESGADWLTRVESLPSDEAKRDAWRRLSDQMWAAARAGGQP
ncbi:hypothetical protein [Nocardia sp. NPDC057227]|uniref:hypothetical protein n=1 Tax=Nocardia sp. NPDC057227 TaxID=3346056 RepID=UPI003629BCAE